MTLLDQTEIFI